MIRMFRGLPPPLCFSAWDPHATGLTCPESGRVVSLTQSSVEGWVLERSRAMLSGAVLWAPWGPHSCSGEQEVRTVVFKLVLRVK